MNMHTPLDKVGSKIMAEEISSIMKKNFTGQSVISALEKLSEFRYTCMHASDSVDINPLTHEFGRTNVSVTGIGIVPSFERARFV